MTEKELVQLCKLGETTTTQFKLEFTKLNEFFFCHTLIIYRVQNYTIYLILGAFLLNLSLNASLFHHLLQQFLHFLLRQFIDVDRFFFSLYIQQLAIVAETDFKRVHVLITTGNVITL